MKISLIMTGRTKFPWIQEGINEYVSRLSHYIPFTIMVTPDIRNTKNMPAAAQKEKEGQQIVKLIPTGSLVILLDDNGKQFSSEGLAGFVQQKMNEGRDICMVIGGAYGFSDDIYNKAEMKLSLSKMTFTHQLVRLIFLEQLYRTFTIIRGEPYHHS